ncbi:RHS repeat protein, partial [Rhodanobacter glycinis]
AMLRPVLSDSDIGGSVQTSTLGTYDAKGQKVFGSYPSATALTFTQTPAAAGIQGIATTYDALGRVTQTQQDSELGTLTSSTAYLSGARQQITDPKGNVTTTSYQMFDSPSYNAPILVQAPAGITQAIARDLYGNPLSISQSGLYGTESDSVTKTLTYDAYHRLCRTTEPESGSTVMAYDGANNLAWSAQGLAITGTGCGQEQVATAAQTARTYDAMNRVLTTLPPSGTQSTQYHYTPLGQPDSVVSGISTWSGSYNYRGMLIGESLQLVGQNAWGLGYAHDAYGSLSLVHYPDGENVSYAPDALGRPTQAGSYATGIGYFPNGQVSQFVYGNGTAYVAEQNARQMLSNFSYGPGSTAQLSEDLSYDANGNITTVADLVAGGPRNKSFGYDALNRLTSASAAGLWGTQAYTYDALNNLRSRTSDSQTSTYHYDTTNKLASITNGASTVDSFQYDNRGNVINKSGANLVFDQKNQLTQIPGYDNYAYDASGRRVMKTPTGGTPAYYFYSQAGQLLYQVDAATLKSTNFIYLGTKLVARDESAAPSINAPTYSGTGSYTVSWNGIGGATSYVLQEQVNGGSWTTIQTAGTTSIAISGKGEGIYGYKVQACNGVTCGSWSSIASTTVLFPPLTPASITVPATSSGSVAVSWAASSSATSYTLQQQLGGNSWSTVYTGAATSSTSSVPTSGNYTYQVAACNPGGCSAYKVSSAVTVTLPPAGTPTLSVPATNSSGSYTASWSGVTAATSYTLQEQINGGGWTTIQTSSATSSAISGKTNGSFGYQVRGCNAGGCGPWSSIGAVAVVLIPAAPTSIVIATSGPSWKPVFTLTWSAMPWATSYQVEETNANGDVTPFYSGPNTTASQLILDEGTVEFRAKSCSTSGCSAWSGYVSQGGATTPPPGIAPTLSVPATSTTGNYTVSWSGVSGATSYILQERVNNGAWGTVQSSAATSLAISGKSSASYGYQVQACNSSGCGPWSTTQTIAVGVIPAVPAAPQISTSGPYYKPVVHASWAAVAWAGSYTLEETDPDGSVSNMYVGPNTTASALILQNGTVKFRVKACSSAGCSAWSGYGSVNLISGN